MTPQIPQLTVVLAQERLLEGAILLDVRNPDEREAGYARDSAFLPLPELAGRLGELDPKAEYVVVCQLGGRSQKACELMADAGIIRSNGKIDAAIAGAKIYLDMLERGEDFSTFLWDMVGGTPIQNNWTAMSDVPAQTPLAVEMAKALKAKGFKYCGPVIVYAFMQAVGMVNDHLVHCPCHARVQGLAIGAAPK